MKVRARMRGGTPAPNKPEKDIPVKPDENPDPTRKIPGGNEPEKNDPTRIEEPKNPDPTKIDEPTPQEPEEAKGAIKQKRMPIYHRIEWAIRLSFKNSTRMLYKTLAITY